MFDETYCSGMTLGTPEISIEGLNELTSILASVGANWKWGKPATTLHITELPIWARATISACATPIPTPPLSAPKRDRPPRGYRTDQVPSVDRARANTHRRRRCHRETGSQCQRSRSSAERTMKLDQSFSRNFSAKSKSAADRRPLPTIGSSRSQPLTSIETSWRRRTSGGGQARPQYVLDLGQHPFPKGLQIEMPTRKDANVKTRFGLLPPWREILYRGLSITVSAESCYRDVERCTLRSGEVFQRGDIRAQAGKQQVQHVLMLENRGWDPTVTAVDLRDKMVIREMTQGRKPIRRSWRLSAGNDQVARQWQPAAAKFMRDFEREDCTHAVAEESKTSDQMGRQV